MISRRAQTGQTSEIIGIGLDIVEIGRMRALLERRGARAIERLFDERERHAIDSPHAAAHFAARFAAKEAFLKALGTGLSRGITWRDLFVVRDLRGAPELRVTGQAAAAAEELGVGAIHVSLTHGRESAVALVVLEATHRPSAT
jgi:holo-[acyl-carrier protein] synthase